MSDRALTPEDGGHPARLGTLAWEPASERPDLMAAVVGRGLRNTNNAGRALIAEIDPDLADTAACARTYEVPLEASVNCVLVGVRRGERLSIAACLVPATTRADVNGVVRRLLDGRKASFLPMADAVTQSGMEYGGITPIGLPDHWHVLVAGQVPRLGAAVIGSGVRRSKLMVSGAMLASLPGARVVADLAVDSN